VKGFLARDLAEDSTALVGRVKARHQRIFQRRNSTPSLVLGRDGTRPVYCRSASWLKGGGGGNRTRVQGFAGSRLALLASGPQGLPYRHFSQLIPCSLISLVRNLVRNGSSRPAAWRALQPVAGCSAREAGAEAPRRRSPCSPCSAVTFPGGRRLGARRCAWLIAAAARASVSIERIAPTCTC
jgi:hypothetical protein